jgi:hypothetical protein
MTANAPSDNVKVMWGLLLVLHLVVVVAVWVAGFASDIQTADVVLNNTMLLVQGGMALAVAGFAVWVTPVRIGNTCAAFMRARPLVLAVGVLLSIVAVWLVPLPFANAVHYAAVAALIPITFGLLYATYNNHQHQPRRWHWALLLALVVVVIGARLYSLEDYPIMHRTDEAWVLAISIHAARMGELRDVLMDVPLPSNELRQQVLIPGYFLPVLWLQIFGESYYAARAFSFALLLLAVTITVWVGRQWYGTAVGILSGIVFLVSGMGATLISTRNDIYYTITMLVAVGCVNAALYHRRWWLHLLAGLMMGVGVFAHLHIPAFAVFLTVVLYGDHVLKHWRTQQGLRRWFYGDVLWFVLGGVLIAALAFVVIVAPDPQGFFTTLVNRDGGNIWGRGFGFALLSYLVVQSAVSPIETLFFLAALLALCTRRTATDIRLFCLILGLYVVLSLIAQVGYLHYARPFVPYQAIAIAASLWRGLARHTPDAPHTSAARAYGVALVVLVLALYPLRSTLDYHQRVGQIHLPPPAGVVWLWENVPSEARILAPTEYYLWMIDYGNLRSTYLDDLQNRELSLDLDGEIIWDAADAEYIVHDRTQLIDMRPPSLFESDYLARNGYQIVAELQQDGRTITIYRRGD